MALFQISNDRITIQVDSMGAELKSLKRVADAKEYLWHGDPAYWGRTSPILFPIVGALKNGCYRIDDREYQMGQHGFARDKEFQLKSQVASEIWFSLHSDEKTLAVYPYPFLLEIGYELTGNTVIVKWRVSNPEGAPVWFSIGGHPAFLCPIDPGTDQTQYRLRFDAGEQIVSSCIEDGLLGKDKKIYKLRDGELPVTADLFDGDALVVENDQAHSVSLVKPDGTPYLTVDFEAPLFGIWSPPKKKAPFICIEPWYGRCDSVDFTGAFQEREWGQSLSGGSFEVQYQIMIA